MATNLSDPELKISPHSLARYREILTRQLGDLERAMDARDFEQIREICHRVRGSAGLFGATELGLACKDAENAAIQKNDTELAGIHARIRSAAGAFPGEGRVVH